MFDSDRRIQLLSRYFFEHVPIYRFHWCSTSSSFSFLESFQSNDSTTILTNLNPRNVPIATVPNCQPRYSLLQSVDVLKAHYQPRSLPMPYPSFLRPDPFSQLHFWISGDQCILLLLWFGDHRWKLGCTSLGERWEESSPYVESGCFKRSMRTKWDVSEICENEIIVTLVLFLNPFYLLPYPPCIYRNPFRHATELALTQTKFPATISHWSPVIQSEDSLLVHFRKGDTGTRTPCIHTALWTFHTERNQT